MRLLRCFLIYLRLRLNEFPFVTYHCRPSSTFYSLLHFLLFFFFFLLPGMMFYPYDTNGIDRVSLNSHCDAGIDVDG